MNLGPADLLDLGLPSEVERLLQVRRCAEHLQLEVSEDVVWRTWIAPSTSSAACARSACAPRSTTSAPATPPSGKLKHLEVDIEDRLCVRGAGGAGRARRGDRAVARRPRRRLGCGSSAEASNPRGVGPARPLGVRRGPGSPGGAADAGARAGGVAQRAGRASRAGRAGVTLTRPASQSSSSSSLPCAGPRRSGGFRRRRRPLIWSESGSSSRRSGRRCSTG